MQKKFLKTDAFIKFFIQISSLDECFIRNRSDGLRNILLGGDMTSFTRLSRDSLEVECN
jgi:hypothetical protein